MDPWLAIFKNTEIVARFPSAIFGGLAIGFLYLLGKELYNHYIGLFSALMMAFSTHHIYYSQTARMYSLMVLLSVASLYYFVKIIKDTQNQYYKAKYILSTVLLCYTHFFGLFILLSEIIYLLAVKVLEEWFNNDKDLNNIDSYHWSKIQSIIGLLISPWLGLLIYRFLWGGNFPRIDWIPPPQPEAVIDALISFIISEGIDLYPYGLEGFETISVMIVIAGLLQVLSDLTKENILTENPRKILLPILVLLIPILGSYVFSYVIKPIFWNRYLIASSIGLYLILGRLLENINNFETSLSQKSYVSLICAASILMSVALPIPVLYDSTQNDQWREVTGEVNKLSDKGDTVIISSMFNDKIFKHYSQKNYSGVHGISEDKPGDVQKIVGDSGEAWLILNYVDDEEEFVKEINSTEINVSLLERYENINLYKLKS